MGYDTPENRHFWGLAEDEARGLSRYEYDWDGEGASPVKPGLIESILKWYATLGGKKAPPCSCTPLAGGTVMVEFWFPGGGRESVEVREVGVGESLTWPAKVFARVTW